MLEEKKLTEEKRQQDGWAAWLGRDTAGVNFN